jgi:hypothetical protein
VESNVSPQKVNTELPDEPRTPPLHMNPKTQTGNLKTYLPTKVCSSIHIRHKGALPKWSTDERTSKDGMPT